MQKAIIGKKIGMTQIFDADGKVIPVTVIEAGPCSVTQIKTEEKEGYNAVQLGFADVAERKLNKPQLGHLKKAGEAVKKYLKEFRFDDMSSYNLGDVLKADVFAEGDSVDITGISKGKGYARHHQAFWCTSLPDEPRCWPDAQTSGFHGLLLRSVPCIQGQDHAGPHGRRAGNRTESGRC